MAITKYPPNTIWLGGPRVEIGDVAASESITPGMLVERINSSGTPQFRKHATAGGRANAYATDQSMLNKGVDDVYAAGDLMEVTVGDHGTTIWALIASGQNLANGAALESAGNGTLRALASGVQIAHAVESKNNSAGPANARCRIEVD